MRSKALALIAMLLLAVPSFALPPPDTYAASVSGQATTAAILLSIEAPAATGFRLTGICLSGLSNATAAAAVTVTVQRRTTASSGGTALTAEGTGATVVSKFIPTSANFPGIARLNGTPGTAGAVLDQFGTQVATGLTSPNTDAICKTYGLVGEAQPSVAPGVANGLSINVSAIGAGGLASGTVTAIIAMGQ
jgi:hypothetical protein